MGIAANEVERRDLAAQRRQTVSRARKPLDPPPRGKAPEGRQIGPMLCRPSGAWIVGRSYQGLTPLATGCRRSAARFILNERLEQPLVVARQCPHRQDDVSPSRRATAGPPATRRRPSRTATLAPAGAADTCSTTARSASCGSTTRVPDRRGLDGPVVRGRSTSSAPSGRTRRGTFTDTPAEEPRRLPGRHRHRERPRRPRPRPPPSAGCGVSATTNSRPRPVTPVAERRVPGRVEGVPVERDVERPVVDLVVRDRGSPGGVVGPLREVRRRAAGGHRPRVARRGDQELRPEQLRRTARRGCSRPARRRGSSPPRRSSAGRRGRRTPATRRRGSRPRSPASRPRPAGTSAGFPAGPSPRRSGPSAAPSRPAAAAPGRATGTPRVRRSA